MCIIKTRESMRSQSLTQGCNARKVNCSCVYSAYILKPVCFEVKGEHSKTLNKITKGLNICVDFELRDSKLNWEYKQTE